MPTDALYFEASKIVDAVVNSKGTIKALCYSSPYSNKKALFALVSETCKNYDVLQEVFDKSEVSKAEKRLSKWLLLVLLQDFLYKGQLGCKPKLKDAIMRHKSRLNSEFVKAKLKLGNRPRPEKIEMLKYARINNLKASTETVVAELKRQGFMERSNEISALDLGPDEFKVDSEIPRLLIFSPKLDLSSNPLYVAGMLIIQDKASCMPAFLLNPPLASTVVDACAAPGNKTSHLSAILENTGKIFAFERDLRRFGTLKSMTGTAGCTNVEPAHADFLAVNPLDKRYEAVEYCLVDPSCSGSGIIKSHEGHLQAQETPAERTLRLAKLSNFQKMIVRHAMKFPNVRKVVYSTCSTNEEENEMVVQEVLEKEPGFTLEPGVFPSWPRRGLGKYPFGGDVIRADPAQDRMHGFFVAVFVRQ